MGLYIVWDAAPMHRGEAVWQCPPQGTAKRIQLVMLLSYSLELSPVGGVRSFLEGILLPNIICHNLSQLWQVLVDGVARLKHKSCIIQRCLLQFGCY